ncbi:hypothetical protein KSC_057510 [Ktedonobacter sp. SOSP1-52]|uniref:hypothetical protein n=1 Tax=Ktedonobacter sp. SOSP1-52 TaxID=2778366 RepID=UPI001915D8F1|nr:hypothetical protein [Ktedonobacter sp. SOSP1-52]GHO66859.1 hypothetical protein KSC_057510 [Ktedonobacter sp. SOSP1-52]
MVNVPSYPGVEIFDGSPGRRSEDYLAWVNANGGCYVANAYKPNASYIIKVHKANCRHISDPNKQNYTETDYFKACSCSLQTLENCIANWPGRVEYCPTCLASH